MKVCWNEDKREVPFNSLCVGDVRDRKRSTNNRAS